jgi:carbon monoxide dehydrogenase subunit G
VTHTFLTTWHVAASPEEVLTILSDETLFPEWWPSAFIWVGRQAQGDECGKGRAADVFSRGFLPYTLRWRVSVVDILPEKDGFIVQAQGDLNGIGRWTVRAKGQGSEVSFFWSVQVGHRLLRYFELLLWPLFRANHRWCMRQGEHSMCLEVRRRRGNIRVEEPPLPLTLNVMWRRLTNAKTPRCSRTYGVTPEQ